MTPRKAAALCYVFAIGFSYEMAAAGPFGLEMGQSLDGLDVKREEQFPPNVFVTFRPPKPHSAFEYYALKAPPSTGLCQINAVGKDVSTSVYGDALKTRFKEIRDQISNVYGQPKTADFLRYGSIWNEPQDWMTALRKDERTLQAAWGTESDTNLKDGITEILLTAKAKRREVGYLTLQYKFTNTESCEQAQAEEESNAF